MQVNCDKIIHTHQDFEASIARIWRESELEKHQYPLQKHYFVNFQVCSYYSNSYMTYTSFVFRPVIKLILLYIRWQRLIHICKPSYSVLKDHGKGYSSCPPMNFRFIFLLLLKLSTSCEYLNQLSHLENIFSSKHFISCTHIFYSLLMFFFKVNHFLWNT